MRIRRNAYLIAVIVAVLFIMFHEASSHLPFSDGFLYFVAVLSGNWSADFVGKVSPFWFATGSLVAVMLNGLTIAAIAGVFLNLTTIRKKFLMNIQNAITLQEATLKDEVLNVLTDTQFDELRPKIEEAFRKGHDIWANKVVPDFMGERTARTFFKRILQPLDDE